MYLTSQNARIVAEIATSVQSPEYRLRKVSTISRRLGVSEQAVLEVAEDLYLVVRQGSEGKLIGLADRS